MSTATITRRDCCLAIASAVVAAPLAACSATDGQDGTSASAEATPPTGALAFDMSSWNHDDDNDVWWRVGVAYCTSPASEDYETLGIYVPGACLTGTDNGDGTYTCELAPEGTAGGHTAADAPIVIPVNTAGYAAQPAPTSYSYQSVSSHLEAGFVYVYPGCRGRANGYDESGELAFAGGAPWGVTDLKAAVRFLRYNAALLPGDTDAVFTFCHSGGGAQSALMGVTGDAEAFSPYLEAIGAAGTAKDDPSISDAIAGAMCWCPITCLTGADAAYEWMMGQFATSGTRAEGTWTSQLSGDLADAFASYVGGLGLVDEEGGSLAREASDEGHYLAGSYHDAVVALVERSLNNFLADTEFPYTPSSTTMADGGFGGGLTDGAAGGESLGEAPSGDGGLPDGTSMGDGELPDGGPLSDGELPDSSAEGAPSGEGMAAGISSEGSGESDVTYQSAAEYVAALNADETWVTYDESSNTATVTSLGGFVRACKSPSKDVGAFDDVNRSQAENDLFGNSESDALHFDAIMAGLLEKNAGSYAELEDWDAELPSAYAGDLELLDDKGVSVTERVATYDPMAYLCAGESLYGTSAVAPHWRISTGIEQGDNSLTTEMNLALALDATDGVSDVDFETVWGQGHATAERTGDSATNFIAWVEECVG